MSEKELSIIIPMYNAERYVRRCIESIIEQINDECEIIVVNDGSIDNSLDIAKGFNDDRIHVFSQENQGQAIARNYGIRKASGKYIIFVDSDDYILPGFIDKVLSESRTGDYDIITSNLIIAGDDGVPKSKQNLNGRFHGEVVFETCPEILTIPTIPVCKAYRRELLCENHLYFPDKIIYEDVAFVPLSLVFAKKILFIDSAYYVYIQHDASTTHRKIDRKTLDILKSNSILMNSFKEREIYEKYYGELEYIALETIISQVFEAINEQDNSSILQNELIDFLHYNYPEGWRNKYLSSKQAKRYFLAYKKRYKEYYFKYIYIKKLKRIIRKMLPYYVQEKVKRMVK